MCHGGCPSKILKDLGCRIPSLGFTTKVKACKGVGQKWTQESHFMFSGMWKSMKEWTHTFSSGFPFWELEFWCILESLEGDCRGQNSLDWKVHYTIKNLLKHRCLKCAYMTHFGSLKHKLWLKEGSGVKLSIWLPTTKVRNLPDLLAFKWCATYSWKFLNKGYNFLETSPQSEVCTKSYGLPKLW
jgi:hypothetical protein